MEFACIFKENGCQYGATRSELQKHMGKCGYVKVECPFLPCKEQIPKWDVINHIKNCHVKKDQNPGRVNRSEGASLPAANTTGSAMSSPAGNDVYRSMVLAFRMSELQVGCNRNVNNSQFCRISISILAARL